MGGELPYKRHKASRRECAWGRRPLLGRSVAGLSTLSISGMVCNCEFGGADRDQCALAGPFLEEQIVNEYIVQFQDLQESRAGDCACELVLQQFSVATGLQSARCW